MILERIADETGLDRKLLDKIVHSASHRYKVYTIPKRKEGRRRIEHPARELKFLQRWMLKNVFLKLPIHEAAVAYRRGANIGYVAKLHCKNDFLLLLDFASVFESIHQSDVFRIIRANMSSLRPRLDEDDAVIISRITTRYGRLSVGAPSSPQISNAVLYEFDAMVSGLCEGVGVVYSRYADDMHFSTNEPHVLGELVENIEGMLEGMKSPNLILNKKKTVFTSRRHKRMVLGLVLTDEKGVSIGRKQKRAIKSLIFRYIKGALALEHITYLRGYLAFARSVEPEFLKRLDRKYGAGTVAGIMETGVADAPR